jgi:hypothetical protein
MSGVEVSREQKMSQVNVCASCMSSVIQSFNHYQERILQLQEEKLKLQMQLDKVIEEQKALENKLAQLKGE